MITYRQRFNQSRKHAIKSVGNSISNPKKYKVLVDRKESINKVQNNVYKIKKNRIKNKGNNNTPLSKRISKNKKSSITINANKIRKNIRKKNLIYENLKKSYPNKNYISNTEKYLEIALNQSRFINPSFANRYKISMQLKEEYISQYYEDTYYNTNQSAHIDMSGWRPFPMGNSGQYRGGGNDEENPYADPDDLTPLGGQGGGTDFFGQLNSLGQNIATLPAHLWTIVQILTETGVQLIWAFYDMGTNLWETFVEGPVDFVLYQIQELTNDGYYSFEWVNNPMKRLKWWYS
tara:strand:+ start:161 stop:1033 length:873 start_codon:yes stop_codon:yes gene_type:complete